MFPFGFLSVSDFPAIALRKKFTAATSSDLNWSFPFAPSTLLPHRLLQPLEPSGLLKNSGVPSFLAAITAHARRIWVSLSSTDSPALQYVSWDSTHVTTRVGDACCKLLMVLTLKSFFLTASLKLPPKLLAVSRIYCAYSASGTLSPCSTSP